MTKRSTHSLYIFIDRSNGVYALIAVEEGDLADVKRGLNWVVHYRKLGKRSKRGLLRAFPRRFKGVMGRLAYSRFFRNPEEMHRFLSSLGSCRCTVYCDDALCGWLRSKGHQAVPESRTPQGLRPLMLLADNLANYCRVMLERGRIENAEEMTK